MRKARSLEKNGPVTRAKSREGLFVIGIQDRLFSGGGGTQTIGG